MLISNHTIDGYHTVPASTSDKISQIIQLLKDVGMVDDNYVEDSNYLRLTIAPTWMTVKVDDGID